MSRTLRSPITVALVALASIVLAACDSSTGATTVEGGASPMGKLLLMPVKGPTTSRIYPPKVFPKVKTPEDFTTIYANRSWRVSAAPGCS